MSYRFSALMIPAVVLTTLCAGGTAFAQNEIWDSYITRINDRPATIMLDMHLIFTAPDPRYPYLVITGPKTSNVGPSGIPGQNEIAELEKVLEATDNFLMGATSRILAGTVTYNGQRNNYYYVRDTTVVRNAIQRMYKRNFPGYPYSLVVKKDAEWLTYRTFLFPNDTTQNWMDNNRNITTMLQKGDSLDAPRTITFAACFPSDSARTNFSSFVSEKGYTIEKSPVTKVGKDNYCVLFSKVDKIDLNTINTTTLLLREEVKRHNGVYNSWSTAGK